MKWLKRILSLVLCVTLIGVFQSVCIISASAEQITQLGQHCEKESKDSGMLIVGDSRCCQIFNLDNNCSSFCAIWGGHYNWTPNESYWIDSEAMRKNMKKYVSNTIGAKGYCNIFIFATVNDWGAAANSLDSTMEPMADNVISLAETASEWSGDYNGKKISPTVYVVELIGSKGKDVSKYNKYLKGKVKESSKIKESVSIEDCLKGDNGGFLSDDLHYTNDTISAITKKLQGFDKEGKPASSKEGSETAMSAEMIGEWWDEEEFVNKSALLDEGINLPAFADLTTDKQLSLREWTDDVENRESMLSFGWIRQVLIFVGILLVVYTTLLYVAFHFDMINNIFEIQLLQMLTLGKLSVAPDKQTSTYSAHLKSKCKGVVHKDMIVICIMGLALGVMILSGKMFLLLNVAIAWVRARF